MEPEILIVDGIVVQDQIDDIDARNSRCHIDHIHHYKKRYRSVENKAEGAGDDGDHKTADHDLFDRKAFHQCRQHDQGNDRQSGDCGECALNTEISKNLVKIVNADAHIGNDIADQYSQAVERPVLVSADHLENFLEFQLLLFFFFVDKGSFFTVQFLFHKEESAKTDESINDRQNDRHAAPCVRIFAGFRYQLGNQDAAAKSQKARCDTAQGCHPDQLFVIERTQHEDLLSGIQKCIENCI